MTDNNGSEHIWLIWSNEHRAWWGPGSMGYVGIIERAGRYSFKTAQEICDGANRYLPEGNTYEVMVLSPEAAVALLADAEKIPVHKWEP